jgi:predicted esterase
MFTCRHPSQVRKQILLAPALIWPEFSANLPEAVDTPTVVYHGREDTLIPLADVQTICQKIFTNLEFHVVDDDHGLYHTVHQINWRALLS